MSHKLNSGIAVIGINIGKNSFHIVSKSITVKQAAADWLAYVRAEKRERATLASYKRSVARHIIPRLGDVKLASLTTPRIQKFRDDLLAESVPQRGV